MSMSWEAILHEYAIVVHSLHCTVFIKSSYLQYD